MIMRMMGLKMAMGAAGLAIAGAFATGAMLGAAGAALACAAGGRFRPPGARWPAEAETTVSAATASAAEDPTGL